MTGPDPNKIHPNENIQQIVYIKNVITRPNIIVGEYSYYDDVNGAERFEEHVTHHYEFWGDRLIIGKFCAIARGIEFVMNGANHRMNSVSTYPFNIMGGGWEAFAPALDDLPLKGDTVVGSDVWIGQNVTVMPGVHIGDGAIIGGGGLGKIAINYGYYRYQYIVMAFAVIFLILLVQIFQSVGTKLVAKCDKRLK